MTQELKPITRGAQELRKLLEEQGSIPKEDVRARGLNPLLQSRQLLASPQV